MSHRRENLAKILAIAQNPRSAVELKVACGIVKFAKVAGTENVADPLTKYMVYTYAMPLLKRLLFWRGETKLEGDPSREESRS
jgi:hypothetical protein